MYSNSMEKRLTSNFKKYDRTTLAIRNAGKVLI